VVFGPLRERVGWTAGDVRDDGRYLRRCGGSGLPGGQDRVDTDWRHGLAEFGACLVDRDRLEGDLATGGRTDVAYLLLDGQGLGPPHGIGVASVTRLSQCGHREGGLNRAQDDGLS